MLSMDLNLRPENLSVKDYCEIAKNIYGKASRKEIEDLKQEGIRTEEFPWIDDKEN